MTQGTYDDPCALKLRKEKEKNLNLWKIVLAQGGDSLTFGCVFVPIGGQGGQWPESMWKVVQLERESDTSQYKIFFQALVSGPTAAKLVAISSECRI